MTNGGAPRARRDARPVPSQSGRVRFAEYAYCRRAWWLRAVAGASGEGETHVFAEGQAAHRRHGYGILIARALASIALLAFAIAAAVLAHREVTLALAVLALALVSARPPRAPWRARHHRPDRRERRPRGAPGAVLRSAKHAIAGKPDYLIIEHGKVAPVEVKPPAVDRPWLRDVVQLAAACSWTRPISTSPAMAISATPTVPSRSISPRAMRAELLRTAERLQGNLSADNVDPNHNDPRRCVRWSAFACRPVTG